VRVTWRQSQTHFGLARLAVWGWSGGGPHALACGALLPHRVAAVACLGSVAPGDAEGLDWFAGVGDDNVAEFGKALRGRQELADYLLPKREARLAGTAEQLHDGLRTLMTAIDTAALTGDFAEFLHRSMTRALENGVEGWIDDDLAFMTPWGFELSDLVVPVLLWHGEHDGFVPAAHGRWLAERLPHSEAHLSREDGHLTLVTRRVPSVHAWLAAQFQP
jgi:pimeloyl-ACP methyl ester carboxylesterase